MKLAFALLAAWFFLVPIEAREPSGKKQERRPSIIQIPPSDGPRAPGLIQSNLGGLDMSFLHTAHRVGVEQIALAELARTRSKNEQILAVADTLASTQGVETQELARLAAGKKVALDGDAGKSLADELFALAGGEFDKAWIERLITVSNAGAHAYAMATKSADADIHSFALKRLPIAQARQELASRLGGRSIPATPAPEAEKDPDAPQPIPPPLVAPAKR